jgi:predicted MFS family arabinose efflux permease
VHPGSWAALLERPHRFSAAVVVLGILAPAFSAFITATVLPSAIAEIGGLAIYAWASTAYAVGSILGSAGSSVVVRRFGMRRAFLLAACVFVVGAAVCGAAPSMQIVVTGRALQGLGGGMLIAAGHGMVRDMFPEALWPHMLAAISAAWGISALGGPALGGVLAGLGLWRIAFWAMAPIAVVAAVLTWRLLRTTDTRDAHAARVPFGRLSLICASVLCVGSIANTGTAALRVALIVAAIAAMALVLRLDRAARVRLLPSGMLSLRNRIGKGYWMIFLLGMSTTPGGAYVPLLVQMLHGVAPAGAGYLYAVQSLAWTAGTFVSARAVGERVHRMIVLGPVFVVSGFIGLYLTIASGPIVAIAAALFLVGVGIGTSWTHVGAVILSSGRVDEGTVTASMIPSTQLFAVALGSALCGIIANEAGLAADASPEVAALAGAWLYGGFTVVPLTAIAVGWRLRPARPQHS